MTNEEKSYVKLQILNMRTFNFKKWIKLGIINPILIYEKEWNTYSKYKKIWLRIKHLI